MMDSASEAPSHAELAEAAALAPAVEAPAAPSRAELAEGAALAPATEAPAAAAGGGGGGGAPARDDAGAALHGEPSDQECCIQARARRRPSLGVRVCSASSAGLRSNAMFGEGRLVSRCLALPEPLRTAPWILQAVPGLGFTASGQAALWRAGQPFVHRLCAANRAKDACAAGERARGAAGAHGGQGALPAGAAAAAGLCGVAVRARGAAPRQQPAGVPRTPAAWGVLTCGGGRSG